MLLGETLLLHDSSLERVIVARMSLRSDLGGCLAGELLLTLARDKFFLLAVCFPRSKGRVMWICWLFIQHLLHDLGQVSVRGLLTDW